MAKRNRAVNQGEKIVSSDAHTHSEKEELGTEYSELV